METLKILLKKYLKTVAAVITIGIGGGFALVVTVDDGNVSVDVQSTQE